MIDHITISVSDFKRAKAFYDKAFEPLGLKMLMIVPPEHTDGVAVGGYGLDRPEFWLTEGRGQNPAIHVALTAANRRQVDEFYTAAIQASGLDNGAPGLRPHYHSSYYGAFVLDPDGNNIEAVCHLPEK